nr:phage baseplate assembly protein V [Paenibacillus arenosi]
MRQNFIYNDKIVGASLQGKILDVAKDTVKVHLEVDKQQSAGEASWFAYASLYTAEGNSGFYCMPEKGDSVMLYFPDGEEKNATAMSSVRKGGGSSPKHADPSVKYWGAPNGKELKMTPSEVSLTAQAGSIFIRMTDDGGIVVKSDKPLTITSKKNMSLDATKKLVISAQEGVEMTCDTSSIILDGQTDIQASVIKVEGLKKNPVTVAPMPELDAAEVQIEEAPKPEKKSFWGSLLDGVQLALDVVGMIPVVGEVADLANGAISLGRGDYVGAALSFAAACPIGGQVATGAKWARKIGKAAKGSKAGQAVIKAGVKIVKAGDRLKNVIDKADILKNVRRVWSQLGGVLTSARNLLSNLSMSNIVKKLKSKMDGIQSNLKDLGERLQEGFDNFIERLGGWELAPNGGGRIPSRRIKHQKIKQTEVQKNYLKAQAEMAENNGQGLGKGGSGKGNDKNKDEKHKQENDGKDRSNSDDEIKIKKYGEWKNDKSGNQKHHLNQDAAFKKDGNGNEVIPSEEGYTIELEGNAFKDIGSPHFMAHKTMEEFFNRYRKGDKKGLMPTNAEYSLALYKSLRKAGLNKKQALSAVEKAREQRLLYGLNDDDPIPKIPGQINSIHKHLFTRIKLK